MIHALVAPETLVAISLETTGLDPLRDGITEVGAVRFDYAGALLDTFWERTNPGIPVPEHVSKLTGIRDDMLAGAGTPEDVVRDFFAWAGPEAWLVAHSGEFEAGFLCAALDGDDGTVGDCSMLSTLQWARRADLGTPNYRMGTLLDYIEFDIRIQPLHGTLIGAQGVADLMGFLLRRGYANPSHAGVKDVLVFRTESLRTMARRSLAEWE